MKVGKRRWLASALLGWVARVVPSNRTDWVRAMSVELSEICSDSEALEFALGCVWAAIVIPGQVETDHLPYQANRADNRANPFTRNPRAIGLACGLASVALGLAYLKIADAPFHYIVVNLCATVFGVGCFIATSIVAKHPAQVSPTVWLGSAALLIGTASFGQHVEGASRWLSVGSVTLQPSLILVPVMLVAYSQRRSLVAAASIILVAIALALQPDRAMAAVLASCAMLLAAKVRDRCASTVALCAMAGLGVTMHRADTLPAVPHVDRILLTAFDVNVATGCAVILGAGLLLLPAVLARGSNSRDTDAYAAFGAVWVTIIAAAAIGNYPTPVVGYGGSAIVGYFLSIAFLPTRLTSVGVAETAAIHNRDEHDDRSEPLENLRGRLIAVGGGDEFHICADHALGTVSGSYANPAVAIGAARHEAEARQRDGNVIYEEASRRAAVDLHLQCLASNSHRIPA